MQWDLGPAGVALLLAVSLGFGVLAQLVAGRGTTSRLWLVVTTVYAVSGLLISEVWFGWATEEDLQPNIDGLSFDEVLLIGLVPGIAAVVVTRRLTGTDGGTSRIAGEIRIAASPERVFDTVADARNEPSYNPSMTGVEMLTPPPVAEGTRFRAAMGRRGLEMLVELTEVDRPHRLSSRSTSALMDTEGSITFEPDGEHGGQGGGTRMRWDWQVRPKRWLRATGGLMGPLGSRMERRTWAGLRDRLEDRADRPR